MTNKMANKLLSSDIEKTKLLFATGILKSFSGSAIVTQSGEIAKTSVPDVKFSLGLNFHLPSIINAEEVLVCNLSKETIREGFRAMGISMAFSITHLKAFLCGAVIGSLITIACNLTAVSRACCVLYTHLRFSDLRKKFFSKKDIKNVLKHIEGYEQYNFDELLFEMCDKGLLSFAGKSYLFTLNNALVIAKHKTKWFLPTGRKTHE